MASISAADDTRLGSAVATLVPAHPAESGLHPLPDAEDTAACCREVGAEARFLGVLTCQDVPVRWRRAFVGSFNFDPRSAQLNTELGLVIESPALAGKLQSFFDTEVPRLAYQVMLTEDGKLEWTDASDGGKVYDTEPGASARRRGTVEVLSVLPIEWLL
jgi:phosphatidylserine/phosphatidylglycerophosphate/cardiolipin synthase-like enzyme